MKTYLTVMLNVPIRNSFTYSVDLDKSVDCKTMLGARVEVPFGKKGKPRIAIVTHVHTENPLMNTYAKVKPITRILDLHIVDRETLELIRIAQAYYLALPADIYTAAFPRKLRDGVPFECPSVEYVTLKDASMVSKRAKKQQAAMEYLVNTSMDIPLSVFKQNFGSSVVKVMTDSGAIEVKAKLETSFIQSIDNSEWVNVLDKHTLNESQQRAYSAIAAVEGFNPFLLYGVTGSGKTEVYFQLIEDAIRKGLQTKIVLPEITLTPQLINRFKTRFPGVGVELYHSKLNDTERYNAFTRFSLGLSAVLIGTRSSVFLPAHKLGLMIVDEEHDTSLKTHEKRFAYNARDMAIIQAKIYNVPVVLGSATPSLESVQNAKSGKYEELKLLSRATNQKIAAMEFTSIKDMPLKAGLGQQALNEIEAVIKAGKQAIIYVNRRGFSPLRQCGDCGYTVTCKSCDKPYHFHNDGRLHCHICGSSKKALFRCPTCNNEMSNVGVGTQRIEEMLKAYFAEMFANNDKAILRIDSDSTSRKGTLDAMLDDINSQETKIIIGTQILSKGHHFKNVELVVVVDVDGELMSNGSDFRALENLSANMIQISGRSGREGKGRVLIQTRDPSNPFFNYLGTQDYYLIADELLKTRKQFGHPPFSHMACVTATSFNKVRADKFLLSSASLLRQNGVVNVSNPLPSPIKKRAGQYSESISVTASSRQELNSTLNRVIYELEHTVKALDGVEMLIDIDPLNVRLS
jgi:primosomal protein N' (replication factor Y) (superfamily II helicase)